MMENNPPSLKKHGVTLTEIMVVTVISAFMLLAAQKVFSRTTSSVKRTSDMLTTQLLLDQIIEKFRSDVRSLVKIKEDTKANEKLNKISFEANLKGEMTEVTYEFIADKKVLKRSTKDKENDFRAAGKIANVCFVWVTPQAGSKNSPFLSAAFQIISDEPGEGKGSQISFVSNFFPKCVEESVGPVKKPN